MPSAGLAQTEQKAWMAERQLQHLDKFMKDGLIHCSREIDIWMVNPVHATLVNPTLVNPGLYSRIQARHCKRNEQVEASQASVGMDRLACRPTFSGVLTVVWALLQHILAQLCFQENWPVFLASFLGHGFEEARKLTPHPLQQYY